MARGNRARPLLQCSAWRKRRTDAGACRRSSLIESRSFNDFGSFGLRRTQNDRHDQQNLEARESSFCGISSRTKISPHSRCRRFALVCWRSGKTEARDISGECMDNELSQLPPGTEPSFPVHTPKPPLNTVFYNDHGLRAGWRITMYIVMCMMFGGAINLLQANVLHLQKTNSPAPWQFFLQESISFAIVFLPACLMAWFEH